MANKPILFYALDAVARAGVTDVGIIVGDTEAEIRERLWAMAAAGTSKVAYIRQSAPLGLAHAVKQAEPFLKKDPFMARCKCVPSHVLDACGHRSG